MFLLRNGITATAILCVLISGLSHSLFLGAQVNAAELSLDQLKATYASSAQPVLERYCVECHGAGDTVEGDINLDALSDWNAAANASAIWQKVAEMLGNGLMPPQDAQQPSVDERRQLQEWVRSYLKVEARKHAGDPGPVVLRRLNNAEYTYTIRDLTGVPSLDPAREFPADGAAGEGFTNTGNALAMSPALVTKYLDAAKELASHAVLLPDGFRFSPHKTARDWTDDTVARIRSFYERFTDSGGGSKVNLQGIVFDTNQGGLLPLEKYLAAALSERQALAMGRRSIADVARKRSLSAKYLGILWARLNDVQPSLLLDPLRQRWQSARPEDAAAMAGEIGKWQKALWKFSSVGLIGRKDGPKRWMEPIEPTAVKQDVRFKIPESPGGGDVTISLVANSAGDGNDSDFVVWQSPRLVAPGRKDILIRDVPAMIGQLESRRARLFGSTGASLAAADEALRSREAIDLVGLAAKHQVEVADLQAWFDYLGIRASAATHLDLFSTKLSAAGGYAFVNGWGTNETPLVLANSSNEHVRIPGNLDAHGVVVHPSPTLRAAVGWRSPVDGAVRIAGAVTHAHPECGNGVSWSVELRRGAVRQRLATGEAHGANTVKLGPFDGVMVHRGDLLVVSIGPRNGNHACDLTAVDLEIAGDEPGAESNSKQAWNLAGDVSADIQAANPHADRFGNAGVWLFFTEPEGKAAEPVIPADSVLAKWLAAGNSAARESMAGELQLLLAKGPTDKTGTADRELYQQLASLNGPLLGRGEEISMAAPSNDAESARRVTSEEFGRHPNGRAIDPASWCVQAPHVITLHLPAELAAGSELVTSATLDPETGGEGSVQVAVAGGEKTATDQLVCSEAAVGAKNGQWSDSNPEVLSSAPVIVVEGTAKQRQIRAAFEEFRNLFPPALCYTKIVPVDEAISVTLFYREDDHLVRLMLEESQQRELDRLWAELHFVSRDALAAVDAFAQLLEFATQDADPKVFEPLRQPLNDRAAAFRSLLVGSEPKQLDALVDFAGLAYRRPLGAEEAEGLRGLYQKLRDEELSHEDAFRLTLARVFVSPAFLYRIERPIEGAKQGPISESELASRLSYFLWSSRPDGELSNAAAAGQLQTPEVLTAQTQRMLRDPKVRRLAEEFACHWLHIDDFQNLDEKSERHFPTFAGLRAAMAEESALFFTDLFERDGSVPEILDADYTFLNQPLAEHYGIANVKGNEWRRVDGVRAYGRGGILAQATTLSKQSGASRTSPILRGNWVSEVLLGEKLPKPPKGVPPLPDDEAATEGLTVRQLVEKHVSDPKCAVCHRRIDAYGFALERYDAIGRLREKDLGDRPIATNVTTMDGATFDGVDGLRDYLLTKRRDAFVQQFCRKLLGYALGRAVRLSDEPLLDEMQGELAANGYKMSVAVNKIVLSRQFREIRGGGGE